MLKTEEEIRLQAEKKNCNSFKFLKFVECFMEQNFMYLN